MLLRAMLAQPENPLWVPQPALTPPGGLDPAGDPLGPEGDDTLEGTGPGDQDAEEEEESEASEEDGSQTRSAACPSIPGSRLVRLGDEQFATLRDPFSFKPINVSFWLSAGFGHHVSLVQLYNSHQACLHA